MEFFNHQMHLHYQAGEFSVMVALGRRILKDKVATRDCSAEARSTLLKNIAYASYCAGDYDCAIEFGIHALDLDASRFGAASIFCVTDLLSLARFYRAAGRLAEASLATDDALEFIARMPNDSQFQRADALLCKANIEMRRQNFKIAEPLFLRAAKLKLSRFGEHHPQFGSVYFALSGLLWKTHRRIASEKSLLKAMKIFELANASDTHEYAAMLSSLGYLQAQSGRLHQARRSYELSRERLRRYLPFAQADLRKLAKRMEQINLGGSSTA